MPLQFVSLFGLLAIIAMAWLCSLNRKTIPWRTVVWGVALQFCFGLFILKTPWGAQVFNWAGRAVNKLIGFAKVGCQFVFGPLADDSLMATSFGANNTLVFAITVTGTIIIVAALSSLFYHYGLLQVVVRTMAWVMRKAMRTSGSETLAAAANIFMGQTEAPLLIKPYLGGMTRSELLCLMVGGMATLAGGVMAAYVSFGVSAGHLLTASVMNAPAALLMAKMLLPESEVSETAAGAPAVVPRETRNGLDALCRGASDGMMLSLNVMAMLIAFVAVVAMLNYALSLALRPLGLQVDTPLQIVLGWLNAPFAWALGVPAGDCLIVGQILGERIVLNEFIAYLSLIKHQATLDPRSVALATYALCGFANVTSVAIQIGGIGSLVPPRRPDLASLGMRAMLGGLLATYLSACIAGVLL